MQQSTYKTLRTEATIAEVHVGTAQDVDTAVKAAKAALVHPSWKLLPGTERGILMGKLADLIEANKEVLASIEAWDNGMHSL
jgi:aldehyde dehydrogenase (NAD+)